MGNGVMSQFSVVSKVTVKMASEGFWFTLSQCRFPVRRVQPASKHCFVSQQQEGTSEGENLFSPSLTVTSNTIATVNAQVTRLWS